MYLQIKTIEKKQDDYGNRIVITKIGLYSDSGKWVRWIKLNDAALIFLKEAKIQLKNNE